MGDEAQKLLALKRAYAEIILNTAKEAAARLMISERKAIRFQNELRSTKEEALGMLIRLKRTLDAKATEAEMKSASQQRKIEELENQLYEAEDVITDLRAELNLVQHKLEKARTCQVQPSHEKVTKQVSYFQKDFMPGPNMSTSNVPIEKITSSDSENALTCRRVLESECHDATNQIEQLHVDPLKNSSTMMTGDEPELCRTGCAPKICACEGKLPARGEDDQWLWKESETIIKINDMDAGKSTAPPSRSKDIETSKKSLGEEVKKFLRHCRKHKRKAKMNVNHRSLVESCNDSGLTNGSILSNKCARTPPSLKCCFTKKLKRRGRFKTAVDNTISFPSVEPCQPTSALKQFSSICVDVDSYEERVKKNECDAEMKPLPSSDPTCSAEGVDKTELVPRSREDLELQTNLGNLESNSAQTLNVSSCETNPEVADMPLINSDSEDINLHAKNISSAFVDDTKLLKYTFQRKRKKFASCNHDGKTSFEKCSVKRRVEEDQNGSPEANTSGLTNESSQDSRRLAQVARQLISLTGKRW